MSRRISVEIVGDASNLQRTFHRAARSATGFNHEIGRAARGGLSASGALGRMGRAASFASTSFLGGAGLVYGIKSTVGMASKLQEETEKTGVVFGKSAHQVQKWSTTLANTFGVGTAAALEASGRFGNMFRPLGIGEKHAAKMSERLVELSADMASFNNAKPDEVLKALSSGLAGQVRPLRQYGVFLDMARLKEEAFRSGLVKANVDSGKVAMARDKVNTSVKDLVEAQKKYGKNSEEAASAQAKFEYQTGLLGKALKGVVPQLTTQQKVQAAFNIILKDTKLQQGDVARNTESLSVAQSKLNASIENTQSALATAALPAIVKYTNIAAKWLGESQNQARIQRNVNQAVRTGKQVFAGVTQALRIVVAVVRPLNHLLGGTRHTAMLLTGAFIAFKLRGVASIVTGSATAVKALLRLTAAEEAASVAGGGLPGAAGKAGKVGKAGQAVRAGAKSLGALSLGIAAYNIAEGTDQYPGVHKKKTGGFAYKRGGDEFTVFPGGRPGRGYKTPSNVTGNVTINVHGAGNPDAVARAVVTHLQKTHKKNAAQRRGRHGGSVTGTG